MKKTVVFEIEDGRKPNVRVEAISKEHACIFIGASTMQEATVLLSQGEEAALEAMRSWVPEEPEPEVPSKEPEHYRIPPVTIEEAVRQMEEYEATTAGSRFKKSLDISAEFRMKKESDQASLGIGQLLYLCNMSFAKDVYSAILASYDLAFRKGYMTAKNQKKKNTERKGE